MRRADVVGAGLIRQPPTGEIGDQGPGRGKSSQQIFKKKRASSNGITVSYNVLETVDTMNCEIIKTVMTLLLMRMRPRLPYAAMCSQKVKPQNFSKK